MEQAKELFESVAQLVTTPKCYDEFFNKMNFYDVECLKSTLSKGLGLGIVVGSSLVKVPQVWKIASSRSAEGISIYGALMELFALSAHMAYCFVKEFPFSSYGEDIFLVLQTGLIALMVYLFRGQRLLALLFLTMYPLMQYSLMSGLAPRDLLWSLQSLNVPIIVAAKLTQALANYRSGSTGQLSAITVTLLFLGSLARIFTSHQETGDTTLIVSYVASSLANGVLVAQMAYYWNAKKPADKGKSAAARKNKSKKAKKSD